ncbi:TetR family transcriptional regulator [Cryobacterium algoricola]|uniref:TetR family transcriptional regulator n=1 Tax=Cryobacterium algoricola TaxID=1259183 RepID=A0ABY2I9R2_9MICO|nr:TetR family transcriptional regulator [Cryobacterium algoricola]TFB85282.1 TetR family transcriptional regulator [Cryobacterium algoricola]
MIDSATTPGRSDRMAATALRLTAVSRRLTAERGLNGFTIEELCAEVGISRRTFFNYFPSKDEAVIGMDETDEARRLAEHFTARGSRGWPAVLDDLVEFAIEQMALTGLGVAEHTDFFAAIEREPRLLSRVIGLGREREQVLALLVAHREGVDDDDPRARAAVALFSTLFRTAVERILRPGATEEFGAALHISLVAVREVAATSNLRKDRP